MSNNGIPMITHVIFDLDGLLIDSEPLYTEVNTHTMAVFGATFSKDLKALTMGMRNKDAITLMIDKAGLNGLVTIDDYRKIYNPLLRSKLPFCEMMPGAMRLVRHLARHEIPMAICSGTRDHEYMLKTMNHEELTELIPLHVCASDDPVVHEGKPSPEPFLVTMSRFPSRPTSASNVLVFEDAPNGVIAAVRAGMHVVMVPDLSYSKPPEEIKNRISFVLESLLDFKPELMGLPPFDEKNK